MNCFYKLQSRVGHLMWSEQAAGPSSMLRWLKFKGMNVNNAERAIKEVTFFKLSLTFAQTFCDKIKVIPFLSDNRLSDGEKT